MGAKGSKEAAAVADRTTHALTWSQPDRHGVPPSPRNGHTCDLIDSKLFIFGGGDKADLLNELHVFNVHTLTWSMPPTTGLSPPARSRHTSAVVGSMLYIWGGIGGGMDVHVLDTKSMHWSTPAVHGDVPESRFGHTWTVVDGRSKPRALLLGGHNSRTALSDVHVLDIETLTWEKPVVSGETPVCGNRHAVALVDPPEAPQQACLLVFAADMGDTFATLYALHFREAGPFRWAEVETGGKAPLSRSRPALVTLGAQVVVLCGVAGGKPLNTVQLLDTRTMTWATPELEGPAPTARMGCTATLVGTDVFLFGGSDGKASLRDLHVLVYVTWFAPHWSGRLPPARVGHTCTHVSGQLYVLGGAARGRAHNDLFVLDPAAESWARPPMYGIAPEALVGHSAALVGQELFIWGGGDGKHTHNSLYSIDTHSLLWGKPSCAGNEPAAHVGHSACQLDTRMFIHGGYGQRQYWNETVVLDTGIMTWMRPQVSGSLPLPSVLHTASVVRPEAANAMMVVVGGALDEQPIDQIVALDLVDMKWARLGYSWQGPRLEPRFGHAAVAIGARLFVFGGTSGEAPSPWTSFLANRGAEHHDAYRKLAMNDLCVLDLTNRTFTNPEYAGDRPAPCYRHTAAAVRGKLFVFGGVNGPQTMVTLDTGLAPMVTGGVSDADPLENAMAAAAAAAAEAGGPEGEGFGEGGAAREAQSRMEAGKAAALVAMLQELGLNKYARTFLRQEVDVESLLQLSDGDLKDMGVAAVGARRKLTAAIHKIKLKQLKSPADGGGVESTVGAAKPGAAAAAAATGEAAADAPPPVETAALDVKYFRARYALDGRAYLGGSAVVKMAKDVKSGQEVAVKLHSRAAYFQRELKYLRQLRSQLVVPLLDVYQEDAEFALVLQGGTANLAELLLSYTFTTLERKLVLERICNIVAFLHERQLVCVDLKPQNLVAFGSIMDLKLIDLECLRKMGEQLPFKLTPFYCAPELAAAALESFRRGDIPDIEWKRIEGPIEAAAKAAGGGEGQENGEGGKSRWGANLQKLSLLADKPTLAKAVAAASAAAARSGDPAAAVLNGDEAAQLDAPLKTESGKPLRASLAMDVWSLGMIMWELFTAEPYFVGCSDDVALSVLATGTALSLPLSRIDDVQAQHLLAKILVKRPKERLIVANIVKHAYLVGGLDTEQVRDTFARLHSGQQQFQQKLDEIRGSRGGADEQVEAQISSPSRMEARRGSALAEKRSSLAASRRQSLGPPSEANGERARRR